MDIRHALNASFHFDEEMFLQGRRIITQGLQAVKANNQQENFEAALQNLGEILHPLQVRVVIEKEIQLLKDVTLTVKSSSGRLKDFYSHSNWVELGYQFPNPGLIRSDTSIGNIAGEKM